MEIKRDVYLDKLIRKKKNGLIKVVMGVRRCGKSYLLFHLFHDHLLDSGVAEDHIMWMSGWWNIMKPRPTENVERSSWRWILLPQKEARSIIFNLLLHFRPQIK